MQQTLAPHAPIRVGHAAKRRRARPVALRLSLGRQAVALAVVGAGIAGFAAGFTALQTARQDGFLTHAFDMGFVLQMVWKLRNGAGSFSTVLGLDVWGDHARLLLYPIAPFLPTSVPVLAGIQSLALASGALPVYLMVRDRTSPGPGLFVAVLYLAYPALHWTALAEVHPEVVATPLLLWALWAADRDAPRAYWGCVVAALAAREDIAVAVVIIGVALALDRPTRRRGLATVGLAVVWFGAAMAVLEWNNPYSLGHFAERYGWLGDNPLSAARNFLEFLTVAHTDALTPRTLALIGAYLLPALPAALAGARRVWVPLPLIVAYAFSAQSQQGSIWFHYGYLVIPLVFWAAADGAGRLKWLDRAPRRAAWAAVFVAAAGSIAMLSPFTERRADLSATFPKPASIQRQLTHTHPDGYASEVRGAIANIRPTESVAAAGGLVPHLAQRDEIYMLPNPFLHMWYGPYLHNPLPVGAKPTIHVPLPDVVVTDSTSHGPERRRLREQLVSELLPRRYDRVFEGDWITVWRVRSHWRIAGAIDPPSRAGATR